MHSRPGKMSSLEYQLAILTDVVETPSDASDHGSFPVASAWPKLPPLAPEKRGSPLRPTSGSRRAVPMYPRARVLLPGLRSPINRVSEASASILIGRAHIRAVHCFKMPSLAKSPPTCDAFRRSASAMLVTPMVRSNPIVAFRKAAITSGPERLRIRLASSPIVTSRT